MAVDTIIALVITGTMALIGIISIVVALFRGDIKKFIEAKMIEAEKLELTGEKKLAYVMQAVKEEYKIADLVFNVRKFIEHIIAITKQINAK